jgi:hypothetical protein
VPCRPHEGCFKVSRGSGGIVPEAAPQGLHTHVRSGEPALWERVTGRNGDGTRRLNAKALSSAIRSGA